MSLLFGLLFVGVLAVGCYVLYLTAIEAQDFGGMFHGDHVREDSSD